METVHLLNGSTFNYRTGWKDKAIRYITHLSPDKTEGLSAYWFDAGNNLICTLIGITHYDFLQMSVMSFIQYMQDSVQLEVVK